MTPYDVIIVGAGPAGLTAATYLARYRRRVLVLDGGRARAHWIPESHNTPGFPLGVSGDLLLRRLRDQALSFGAEIETGLAQGLTPSEGVFEVSTTGAPLSAAAVLLATGVVDRIPPLAGIEAAIRDSRVRMCPICDAFEAIDRPIAVLGDGPLAAREATFLRTYSQDVTLLVLEGGATQDGLDESLTVTLADLRLDRDGIVVARSDASALRFDHLYLALGCAPQSELALHCGAAQDDSGALVVDAHQMTTTPGLYAAGDVVRGLNQIAVAAGEAAIAATAIHNRLRGL